MIAYMHFDVQHYATMGRFCRVCGPVLCVAACQGAVYQLLYMPHSLWAEAIIVYERALKSLSICWQLLKAKQRQNEIGGIFQPTWVWSVN